MGNKHKRGKEWRVVDPETLAAVLRSEFGTQPNRGWQSAAARRLGISRSQFCRLLRGTRTRLSYAMVLRLVRGLSPARRVELRAALVSPGAEVRLDQYKTWLERELEWLGMPSTVTDPITPREWGKREEAALRDGFFFIRASSLFPGDPLFAIDLWPALEQMPAYRRHFTQFRQWLANRWGEGAERFYRTALAELQVVAPLAAAERTGGIERSVQELHGQGELAAYLEAAFKAQRLLLARPPARHQAELPWTPATRDMTLRGRAGSRRDPSPHP